MAEARNTEQPIKTITS